MKRISVETIEKFTLGRSRKRFAKDESGAVLVFSLVLFVLMVMMGGLAVDLMRYETTRTTIQNTLDRATLASANLSQTLDPEDVVRDYFAKAGMTEYLNDVTVTTGLNFRNVNADASADSNPIFLHMIGISEFEAVAMSEAEQRINNVEIALVLDVSRSMEGTKITNLRSAASEFVKTVLDSDGDDRISIALVPYNGQVNLGTTLGPKFNLTMDNANATARCTDLPASVYLQSNMSRTDALPMTAYADTYSSNNKNTAYDSSNFAPDYWNRWCPESTVNVVRPPLKDITKLQGYINNLTPVGATSINAGMKWGLAMLDPDARPMFSELATSNVIPSTFGVRPFEYTDKEAMKVIVLMTDGSHFAEDRMNPTYKSGNSPIYKGSDGYYSIKHTTGRPTAAGTKQFFVPHKCTSTDCKSGTNTAEAWYSSAWNATTPRTWPQVWADARVSWVAWQLYARALGTSSTTRNSTYSTWMTNFRTQTAIGDMDTQLQSVCNLAKAQKNVVVYGIAFDAPAAGQQQIKMCTSGYDSENPNDENPYYFASTPSNIKTAFRAIATNITQLRLTQ
jgi:Flp pilus assembly protein TadG